MINTLNRNVLLLAFILIGYLESMAQFSTSGCVIGGFGVNSTIYTNTTFSSGATIPPSASLDWFKSLSGSGRNVIDQTNPTDIQNILQGPVLNPTYVRRMNGGILSQADVQIPGIKYRVLVDAVWARDNFGGTGALDTTAFVVSSKNGQDPAVWSPGIGNVLGKNDVIDLGIHMFRDVDKSIGKNDLYFVGLINRAAPNGAAYMDFEFFVKDVFYDRVTNKFNSGGPDLGHTSFRFDVNGNITKIGDVLFNESLTGGGNIPELELRIWVKYTDYLNFLATPANLPFRFGPFFDGASNGAPYGYASVLPKSSAEACGFVNLDLQQPSAPLWGTKNTAGNIYTTFYEPFSVSEVGLDMTAFGIDYFALPNADSCSFPWLTTMIKTRSSAAFTAALKDFTGPYSWGQNNVLSTSVNSFLSCSNPVATLTASPLRADATYLWSTTDGNIVGSNTTSSIQVDKAGTYFVQMTLATGCSYTSPPYIVSADPSQPFITNVQSTSTVSCKGNNGSITLNVTGGTAPFTYSWTGPGGYTSVSKNITGLAPGSYTVVVSDSKGCQFTSQPITVLAGTPISILSSIINVACNAASTGSIDITPSGKSPFTYNWNTGNTTQDLVNISAGNYTVTITDADGCDSTFSFSVIQPAVLSSSTVKVNDTDADIAIGNGSVVLSVSGGSSPYTYSWTGPNGFSSTTKDISGLKYGSYTVTITDSKGCIRIDSVFIYEPEICDDGIDNDGDNLTDCEDPECVPASTIITGNLSPCINVEVTYTVPLDTSKTGITYQWTLPSNAILISGQGTNIIVIKFTTVAAAQLCVVEDYVGCISNSSCIVIYPTQVPAQPGIIIKN